MTKDEFEEQSVRRDVLEWFDNAADSFDRVAAALRACRNDFERSFDNYGTKANTLAKPSDVLGWALNATASVQSNARFDLAVVRAAKLSLVENHRRQKALADA